MKKVIFGLIATIMFGNLSSAQSKEEIENYSVVSSEKVSSDNETVKDFLSKTNFLSLNKDIEFNNTIIEIQKLKNNDLGILIPLKNNEYQFLYVFKFKNADGYTYNFLKSNENNTYTYSEDRILLLTANNNNGVVNLIYNSTNRSKFGQCMDAVEDDFTDSLVGWVYWNANPSVQALAAGLCYSCTRWGAPCPAAYNPKK